MSVVQCNWDQDISSCVRWDKDTERNVSECILYKCSDAAPLTLSLPGHCTECTIVSSCRTVECYVKGLYTATSRGDVIQKEKTYTVYHVTVKPNSSDTSLKLLSNSTQNKAKIHLLELTVIQGDCEPPNPCSSKINIPRVKEMISEIPLKSKAMSEDVLNMMELGGGISTASLRDTMLPFLVSTKSSLPNNEQSSRAQNGPTMTDVQAMLGLVHLNSLDSDNKQSDNKHSDNKHSETQYCNFCQRSLKEVISKSSTIHEEVSELRKEVSVMRNDVLEAIKASEKRTAMLIQKLLGATSIDLTVLGTSGASTDLDGGVGTIISDSGVGSIISDSGVHSTASNSSVVSTVSDSGVGSTVSANDADSTALDSGVVSDR